MTLRYSPRRRPRYFAPDPVASYDGLCQYGNGRIPPERMSEIAQNEMAKMEGSPIARRQDEEANQTPIGGMQFR